MKLQYVAMEEQIADVLTKPLARVKFEYFKEKIGVLQIKVPSKGKWWAHAHSDVIEGLVPTWSDIRVDAIIQAILIWLWDWFPLDQI